MRARRRIAAPPFTNPVLVGAVAILFTVVAVSISYIANNGLPFVPTEQIAFDYPDAVNLAGAADVRIGGARVGQVKSITAVPSPQPGHPPIAKIEIALQQGLAIPVDTTVSVLPASILGAKYVALVPGHSRRLVADGGTLPLSQARPAVELSDTFNLFNRPTTSGLRSTILGLGDALAGRGADLNDTIAGLGALLPPLERVLQTVNAHPAQLAGLIDGASATTGSLAPVAPQLVSLLSGGTRTLAAIDAAGSSLGTALDELPGTEQVGTAALTHVLPALSDAATLARALRPGTRALPSTTLALAQSLETARTVLARAPGTLAALPATFDRLGQVGGSVRQALDQLAPALTALQTSLTTIEPAQVDCNVGGVLVRNVDSTFSEGDALGSWLRVDLIGIPLDMMTQQPKPSRGLHLNYNPVENAQRCEAGNEPYSPGTLVGNPAGPVSNQTALTYPPPGVTRLAVNAGVLPKGSPGP